MHVNTSVVKALMALRGINAQELCNLAHVSTPAMRAWLLDETGENEEVPFDTQLEVLALLGIRGEMPRADIVHYWRVHEPFFGRFDDVYWALQVALRAFGPAQATFVGRERDQAMAWSSTTHFMLRFPGFMAMLEITSHPIKSVAFDPAKFPDMTWMPETFGVLLPEKVYDNLQPGALQVRDMTRYLTVNAEMSRWEKLRDIAFSKGILAAQIEGVLPGLEPAIPSLIEKPEPPPSSERLPKLEKDTGATERKKQDTAKQARHTSASAAIADVQSVADDLRLFVTPVQQAEPTRAKRVA